MQAPSDSCVRKQLSGGACGGRFFLAALGCSGPNQAKAFTRCGMGPCQGRLCGATVEQIFAQERGLGVAEIGRYRARPPLQPITLGQLARTPGDET